MINKLFLFKKSQVLIIVLIITLFVSVISAGLVFMWHSEKEVRTKEKNSLIAFYLAQAGLERAKIFVYWNWQDFGLYEPTGPHIDLDVAGDNFQYEYYYDMTAIGGSHRRVLEGKGIVMDLSNNVLAQRTLTMEIREVRDNAPNDGWDDDMIVSVDSFSWREF